MRDSTGRFQAGVSGNPRGRPRDRGLQYEIEQALAKRIDGRTRLQLVADKVVQMALDGDMRAAEFIGKRLWPEKLAIEGKSEPLLIIRDFTGRSLAASDRRESRIVDVEKLENVNR